MDTARTRRGRLWLPRGVESANLIRLAFTRQNLHGARGQSRSVHSKNAKGLSVFVSASFKSCATPPPAHPVLQAD